MTRPCTTWTFTSPESLIDYTISLYLDGRMACSCPRYQYKNTCKHLDLPSNVQRRVWELKKVALVAPAPVKRKPTLQEIFDNAVA